MLNANNNGTDTYSLDRNHFVKASGGVFAYAINSVGAGIFTTSSSTSNHVCGADAGNNWTGLYTGGSPTGNFITSPPTFTTGLSATGLCINP
jgi:hypothetical protein